MRLGDRLRILRKQKNWKQHKLAELAGTNQAVIQKIENHKSLRPRCISALAKVLDVSSAFLMFGEEPNTQQIDNSNKVVTDEAFSLARKYDVLNSEHKEQIRQLINRYYLLIK